MRDGRFATPRFNAAVDGAPMLRARSEVARRKSVELKQDFFEILAYRDTITRCDNRTRSPCCALAASGHAAAPPSSVMNSRRFNRSDSVPASQGQVAGACLIVAPQRGYDEPAILSYAISSFCPTSADGLQCPDAGPTGRDLATMPPAARSSALAFGCCERGISLLRADHGEPQQGLAAHAAPLVGWSGMMRTIGAISDTHGLLRPQAFAALAGCDPIIHAGDVGSPDVLARLGALAPVHERKWRVI